MSIGDQHRFPSSVRHALRLAALSLALIASSLALLGAAPPLQEACPADQSCVDVAFLEEFFRADFFVDGQQVASGGAQRLIVTPNASHRIEARNIRSDEEGYGDVFVYSDSYLSTVYLSAGRTRLLWAVPQREFLKGYVEVLCDVRARAEGHDVRCRPDVTGQRRPDIAPGERATYPLLPGSQTVHIDLVGSNADLWAPASRDHTVNVSAGSTTPVTSTFQRRGLLTISFASQGVTGDIFVDGVQIARNAASAEVYVEPTVSHAVEGRAINDPQAGNLYVYQDVSTSVLVSANSTRAVTLTPGKNYLLGFLSVSCRLYGKADGEEAFCNVAVGDRRVGTLQSGESATYNLTPGSHTVAVSIGGAQSRFWAAPAARTLTISAGNTSTLPVNLSRLPALPSVTAANRMLAYIPRVRAPHGQIADIWRALKTLEPVYCGSYPSVPADYSLTSTELAQAPELASQVERLNFAIGETRRAVDEWRAECSLERYRVPVGVINSGMSAVNNAENAMNEVESRLNNLVAQAQ